MWLAPEGYGEVLAAANAQLRLSFSNKQIAAHGLPKEHSKWYLDLRAMAACRIPGFGMGIERCTAWMCGIEHVRETIPFPRMLYRLKP